MKPEEKTDAVVEETAAATEQSEQDAPTRSYREKVLAGFRSRNPEVDIADDVDDETLYRHLGEGYKGLENKHKELEGWRDKNVRDSAMLLDIFAAKPELVQEFGLDDEDLIKTLQSRAEQLKENEKLQADFDANLKKSLEDNVQTAFTELEATDEEKQSAFDFVANILSGNISAEMITNYINGLRHEEEVAAAEQKGETRGRNEKIVEEINKSQQQKPVLPQTAPSAEQLNKVAPQTASLTRVKY